MSEKNLYELLSTLNIPVAYDHFEEYPLNKVTPPFITYTNTDPTTTKAEDVTWHSHNNYIIDLVTDKKDVQLEAQLESLFFDNEMPYDKEENYIDDERIYQIRYYTN